MEKFIKHMGIVTPLNISNIDTDIIIPKQFLKKTNKIGFGKYLFYDWRYINNNIKNINKKFILNKKKYLNSSILLTKDNFGCGSSREHAVWALKDYGYKIIISSSFSDIFYNNSLNNFLLPIILKKKIIDLLFFYFKIKNNKICFVDLINNSIIIKNKIFYFKIKKFYKICLIKGLDSIDMTMKYINYIIKYEKNIPKFLLH